MVQDIWTDGAMARLLFLGAVCRWVAMGLLKVIGVYMAGHGCLNFCLTKMDEVEREVCQEVEMYQYPSAKEILDDLHRKMDGAWGLKGMGTPFAVMLNVFFSCLVEILCNLMLYRLQHGSLFRWDMTLWGQFTILAGSAVMLVLNLCHMVPLSNRMEKIFKVLDQKFHVQLTSDVDAVAIRAFLARSWIFEKRLKSLILLGFLNVNMSLVRSTVLRLASVHLLLSVSSTVHQMMWEHPRHNVTNTFWNGTAC